MKIPIAKTNLNDFEKNSVLEPLNNGWLVQGKKVREFEDMWCNFTNAKYSIAVTSCTTALHLSLAALGFGPKDEAIVPAFTWISTANVIEHLGGKVIFADIDLSTFNINLKSVESLVTKKTKAILPVHLFGLSANMREINRFAKENNLLIIEDAACGFGSTYAGQHVGTFGNSGCFSFHPRKAITTGEGGMITTNDENLALKLRCLRDHGASISDLQRHHGPKPFLLADHPEAGYNQRMTDIQAALGAAQMLRAKEIVLERQNIAKKYDSYFKNLSWLRIPFSNEIYKHSYQSYPCLFEPEKVEAAIKEKNLNLLFQIRDSRNSWMEELQNCGISTRPATHAVHQLSYYKNKYNLKPEKFIRSFAASECSISLPLFHGMNEKEQDYVIKTVLSRN